jgi:hypothetical protein
LAVWWSMQMNERIRELIEQANLYARSDNSSMLFENYQKRYTEKFAELIVKECALTAGLMEHEGRKNIGATILDRFGVEE